MIVVRIHPRCREFINSFPKSHKARLEQYIDLLKTYGYKLRMPQAKKLDQNLFELRIKGLLEVRLLYCFYQREAVILHGFKKKSQKTPRKELLTVQKRMQTLTMT